MLAQVASCGYHIRESGSDGAFVPDSEVSKRTLLFMVEVPVNFRARCARRSSTDAQDLTSQLAQLKAAGCEKVFREKLTGTNTDPATASKTDSRPRRWRRGDHPGS